ncbi:MAG: 2-oxo acid dehydrogenase subunit E2, partial [Nitrospinae bacterium]|nr:2-oxo acid dehydrogenase subunit E2 [Nitrospinota bacterium]
AAHRASGAACTMLTAVVANPSRYGRVVRQGEQVARIVEDLDATPDERAIHEINVGVAVSLPEGLMVPVIRQADAKHLAEIARESRTLAQKAREGKASYDEVTGGTFTITNLGSYGIDAFTPIINPPQIGILGVGRVIEKPVVYQGEITKRSMMFLSLTFDHRVIDGAPAAAFLRTVKDHLEDPWWMVA